MRLDPNPRRVLREHWRAVGEHRRAVGKQKSAEGSIGNMWGTPGIHFLKGIAEYLYYIGTFLNLKWQASTTWPWGGRHTPLSHTVVGWYFTSSIFFIDIFNFLARKVCNHSNCSSRNSLQEIDTMGKYGFSRPIQEMRGALNAVGSVGIDELERNFGPNSA